MACVGRSESPPTLRLYQWDPPTISLGYFQRYVDYESLPAPAGTLSVVRRLTGGGAILHDLELTYSLTLPSHHELIAKGSNRLYELAHEAVVASLGSLGLTAAVGPALQSVEQQGRELAPDSSPTRGPFFCFERRHRYDVLIGEGKVAGSAQRRTHKATLQHGSIILGNRYAQQATAAPRLPFDDAILHLRSGFVEQLAKVTAAQCRPGDWSAEELAAAQELIGKYAGDAWTKRS